MQTYIHTYLPSYARTNIRIYTYCTAVLPALVLGCERLVLVGDQNQLPPVVLSPIASGNLYPPLPYTLYPIYPIPFTLYPIPYIPYTLYHIPYTLYYTLYPIPDVHMSVLCTTTVYYH